jgi:hypothetical protein
MSMDENTPVRSFVDALRGLVIEGESEILDMLEGRSSLDAGTLVAVLGRAGLLPDPGVCAQIAIVHRARLLDAARVDLDPEPPADDSAAEEAPHRIARIAGVRQLVGPDPNLDAWLSDIEPAVALEPERWAPGSAIADFILCALDLDDEHPAVPPLLAVAGAAELSACPTPLETRLELESWHRAYAAKHAEAFEKERQTAYQADSTGRSLTSRPVSHDAGQLAVLRVGLSVFALWKGSEEPRVVKTFPHGAVLDPVVPSPYPGSSAWRLPPIPLAGLELVFDSGAWRTDLEPPELNDLEQSAPGAWAHGNAFRQATPLEVVAKTGEAWFPVALASVPETGGMLVRVRCAAIATDAGDRVLRDQVTEWIGVQIGSREALDRRCLPLRIDYPEGVSGAGASHGLACAMAMVSALLDEPPRIPIVCSARLRDGRAVSVGAIETKRRVVEVERPDLLSALRLADAEPPGKEVDVGPWIASWFGEDWRERLAARLSADTAEAAAEVAKQEFEADRHDKAAASAEEALRLGAIGMALGLALWVRGACRIHRGETADGYEDLLAARGELEEVQPDEYDLEHLEANLGTALVDLGRPTAAAGRLLPVLDALRATPRRSRQWQRAVVRVSGALHRAEVVRANAEVAIDLLSGSLALAVPDERARTLGDLAEVCRKSGRGEAAMEAIAAAHAALSEIVDLGTRAKTRRFVELFECRLRAGAAALPGEGVWPGLAERGERVLVADDEAFCAWVLSEPAPSHGLRQAVLGVVARRLAARPSSAVRAAAQHVASPLLADDQVEAEVHAALSALMAGTPGPWAARSPY